MPDLLLDRRLSGKDSPRRVATFPSRAPTDEGARRVGTIGIHLLGAPWIEVDRERAAGPRGWKAWALLAYLIITQAPVPRERLAELLFGDADDPLGALRWNLAELRRSLRPSIEIGGDPVVLALPADAFVDVLALGSATWVEAVQVPALGRDLLEGIDVQAGAAFESWLRAERRHAASVSTAVLREAATARLAMGWPDQALALATRLVALDEFDEEANILMIRTYLAIGAEQRAREHLESAAARIREELGTDPSPALMFAIDNNAPFPPSPSWVQGSAAGESLITAGEAAVSAGVFDAGLEILRRAVVVAQEAGDPELEARALIVLGTAFVHSGRGRGSDGATALHAGLQIAERVSADGLVSEASRELGYLDMKQAHYERAAAWLEHAVASAPDRGSVAAAAAIQGVVTADRGMTSSGAALLTESRDIAATLDKPRLEAWSLAFLHAAICCARNLMRHDPVRLAPSSSAAAPGGSTSCRTHSRCSRQPISNWETSIRPARRSTQRLRSVASWRTHAGRASPRVASDSSTARTAGSTRRSRGSTMPGRDASESLTPTSGCTPTAWTPCAPSRSRRVLVRRASG